MNSLVWKVGGMIWTGRCCSYFFKQMVKRIKSKLLQLLSPFCSSIYKKNLIAHTFVSQSYPACLDLYFCVSHFLNLAYNKN